jgi:hypothetical protein
MEGFIASSSGPNPSSLFLIRRWLFSLSKTERRQQTIHRIPMTHIGGATNGFISHKVAELIHFGNKAEFRDFEHAIVRSALLQQHRQLDVIKLMSC